MLQKLLWLIRYLTIAHSLPFNVVKLVFYRTLMREPNLNIFLLEYAAKLCRQHHWPLRCGDISQMMLWSAEKNHDWYDQITFGFWPGDLHFVVTTSPKNRHKGVTFQLNTEMLFYSQGEPITPEYFFIKINKVFLP